MATVANMPEQETLERLRTSLHDLRVRVADHEDDLAYSPNRKYLAAFLGEALGCLRRAQSYIDEAIYLDSDPR